VHTWFIQAIIKAGFTAYGLYVLYSPQISKSCWSSNPCEYYGQTTLQSACVRDATGETTLTPACQVVFPLAEEYLSCAITWSEYGAGWMVENYRGTNETTGDAYFDFPGVVDCSKDDSDIDSIKRYLNQRDVERYDVIIGKWPELYKPDNLYGFLYSFYVIEDAFARQPEKAQAWLEGGMTDDEERDVLLGDNFIADYMTAAVRYASGNTSATIEDTPWNRCMSPGCMELLSQNCTQWRIMAELPNVYQWRGLFETVMYVSVAVIVLTVLIFVLSFNAFPDYQSKEAWEGLLTGLARRLERYADYDQTWLAGVGGLLYGLFGGVDLDITDLLLGLYLVWLRQKWKRRERVVAELERRGVVFSVVSTPEWSSALVGFLIYPFGLDWRLGQWLFGGSWFFSGSFFSGRRLFGGSSSGVQGSPDKDDKDDKDDKSVPERFFSGRRGSLPGVQGSPDDDKTAEEATEAAGIEKRISRSPLDDEGEEKRRTSRTYMTLQHSMATIPSLSSERPESGTAGIRVEELQQSRAFLTPLALRRLEILGAPPESPLEELYLGKGRPADKVDAATLEMLAHYLPFARASYGLNRGAWKACTKYRWYDWGYRVGDPAYFERKNYEMLLEMMGVGVKDVLHASYDLGTHLKPYLVVMDGGFVGGDGHGEVRSHAGHGEGSHAGHGEGSHAKKIVVSIRGTVGAADLITDLLSQPVDDGSGTMYHVGMLSSARAIVTDMKAKGVWDDLVGNSRKGKVVLTGHSLGAGLAYLVAVELVRSGADRSRVACVAFNPPGGLSSESSSRLESHHSVIVNMDAISRMSITTMKRLVDDMMISLSRCNRPKLSIFFDGVLLGRYAESDWRGVFKPLEGLCAEERGVLHTYLERGKLTKKGRDEYVTPMYPPGKLVFLRRVMVKEKESWDAVWVDAEELMDEGLLVGMGMGRDHMLGTTAAALAAAISGGKGG
jgi:hypothetical protein